MWGLTVLVMSALIGTTAYAMDDEDYKIEFKGEKKPALGFINRAALDPDTDPFCNTDVLQYDEKNKKLSLIGNIRTLLENDQQTILGEIAKGNCVYKECYMIRKVNFRYENIGAFIVGTKDKETLKLLHFYAQQAVVSPHKQ